MIKVKIIQYDDLTDAQKEEASTNGCGKEYANYLLLNDGDGNYCGLWSDAMEPEDATFTRDLKWIKDLLIEAYKMGEQTNKRG